MSGNLNPLWKPASLFAAINLLIATTAISAVYTIDGPVVSPLNGHSYFLLSQSTWLQADSKAVEMGGHLATVRNAQEDAWLWNTFSQQLSSPAFFIGLTDAAVEGTWVWSSGEVSAYRNWGSGEPSNFWVDEDYAQYFPTGPYASKWNNTVTSELGFGVAEIVPEPSTFALALCALGLALLGKVGRMVP